MKSFLRRNRKRIEEKLVSKPAWQYFSPIILSQYRIVLPQILTYAHGRLIDLGCGKMPYREKILPFVTQYDGLDLFSQSDQIKYQCSIEQIDPVDENSYETAISIEVLEHVPRPWRAVSEVFRILSPGGVFILSVPHLSRLHDEPHDYYRYTKYGLSALLTGAGFESIQIHEKGGIFSFIGHQFSSFIIPLTWSIPIISQTTYFLNAWVNSRFLLWLDRVFNTAAILPQGYVAIAFKPTHE